WAEPVPTSPDISRMPARPMPYRPFRRNIRPLPVFCLLSLLAACGGDDEAWPQLLPSDQLLAEPAIIRKTPEARDSSLTDAALSARAQDLQSRAGQLRRKPLIDPDLRTRLDAARDG